MNLITAVRHSTTEDRAVTYFRKFSSVISVLICDSTSAKKDAVAVNRPSLCVIFVISMSQSGLEESDSPVWIIAGNVVSLSGYCDKIRRFLVFN